MFPALNTHIRVVVIGGGTNMGLGDMGGDGGTLVRDIRKGFLKTYTPESWDEKESTVRTFQSEETPKGRIPAMNQQKDG